MARTTEVHALRRHRILDRRADRAARSGWPGRLIFSAAGIGLLLALRLDPGAFGDVVLALHATPDRTPQRVLHAPAAIEVRIMPADAVPARRGGLPGTDTHAADNLALADTADRRLAARMATE